MRFLFPVLVVCAALGASACGSSDEAVATGSVASPGGSKAISVSATEFSFDPGTIQIDEPGTYTFTLANDGGTEHALEIEGQGLEEETETVASGSSGELTVTFSKTGTYDFYCPVDGHRERGMEGTLTVGAASAGSGTTDDDDDNGGSDTEDKGGGYGYG